MNEFIIQCNIKHYREKLECETCEERRHLLRDLLAKEEAMLVDLKRLQRKNQSQNAC